MDKVVVIAMSVVIVSVLLGRESDVDASIMLVPCCVVDSSVVAIDKSVVIISVLLGS